MTAEEKKHIIKNGVVYLLRKYFTWEGGMRKCECGTVWTGFGIQPRQRETCDGCREYLHRCVSCRHFVAGRSECPLNRDFVGEKKELNFCEEFEILDSLKAEEEEKANRANTTWENLFRRN